MKRRRRDQKEAPLEPRDLINDNTPSILLTEQLLRLLRNMPGEASEGDNRDQPEGPWQGRKNQKQGDSDQRSRRSRSQGRVSAPEARGRERDEFFIQETPLFIGFGWEFRTGR